ncbi:MAG: LPS export ABC transporter periplasmic protein LptC [Gammaproteobacteria bacterium]
MDFNLRNTALFLLLAGAAITTWMLSRPPEETTPIIAAQEPQRRGYFLEDAVFLGTNENGNILFRAYVDRVEKLIDDENFSLDDIRIEYAPGTRIHWEVLANRGRAPLDLTFFDLSDGVRLNYADLSNGSEAIVETDTIHFDAKNLMARTDSEIMLRSTEGEVSGLGLEADLGDDSLTIKSNVTARPGR